MTQKPKKEFLPSINHRRTSGYTRIERQKMQRVGDRIIKDIRAGKNKPAKDYEK